MRSKLSLFIRVQLAIVLFALLGILVASGAEVLAPLEPRRVEDNVGIFVGVGRFQSRAISSLAGPANDAVAIAQRLVLDLRIVPPRRAFLVVEGELSTESQRWLSSLEGAGVSVSRTASKRDVLRAIESASRLSGHSDAMVFFSASTHGCQINGAPYICPSDAGSAPASMISLTSEVRDPLKRSHGGQQVFVVDACRVELAGDGTRAIGDGMVRSSLGRDALSTLRANVLVGACSPGQVSLDSDQYRMGIFSKTFVDGLGGKASQQGSGNLTLGQLLAYVAVNAEKEARDQVARRGAESISPYGIPKPWFEGEASALSLPLARTRSTGEPAGASAPVPTFNRGVDAVVAGLRDSMAKQPKLFTDTNRADANKLMSVLTLATRRDLSWMIGELTTVLAPADSRRTKDAILIIRRLARLEEAREKAASLLKAASRSLPELTAAEFEALNRLENSVLNEPPPAVESLINEVSRRFSATDKAKNRSALTWWMGELRERRRDAISAILVQARSNCSDVMTANGAAVQELLTTIRGSSVQGIDLLLAGLEIRLENGNCTALEAALSWWMESLLDQRKARTFDVLARARQEQKDAATRHAEALDRLRDAVRTGHVPQVNDLLAEIDRRLNLDSTNGLNGLVEWWRETERKGRIATIQDSLRAVMQFYTTDQDQSRFTLVQILGAVSQELPPQVDGLLDEVGRRLDLYDPTSVQRLGDWWKGYKMRDRRTKALQLVIRSAAVHPEAVQPQEELYRKMTNSLATLKLEDLGPLISEIETHLSPNDGSSLGRILDIFRRQFDNAPSLDLVISVLGSKGGINAGDFAEAIKRAFEERTIGLRIKTIRGVDRLPDDNEVEAVCRKHGATSALIVEITEAALTSKEEEDPGSPQSGSIRLYTANLRIEVVAGSRGSLAFQGNYPTQNLAVRDTIAQGDAKKAVIDKLISDSGLLEAIKVNAYAPRNKKR